MAPFAGSFTYDWTTFYGRHPETAFVWGAVVVLIGALVFSSKKMEVRKREDACWKYSAFWYSLDLFVPAIDLQDASIWIPREEWRFGRNYMRVQRILGWILIPIGLAALAGIVK
jgi:hypothetical protein